MATFFMNLDLPQPRTALSPTWATQLNTALTEVDSHDHTSGEGQRLTSAGINIDSNLAFSEEFLRSVQASQFTSQDSALTTNNSCFVVAGEVYFRDGASNDVQITNGGAINFSGFGGVGGDYSSTAASITYDDTTKKYTFQDSTLASGDLIIDDLECTNIACSGVILSTFTLTDATLDDLTITGDPTFTDDVTLSGNNTGRGIVPVGGVLLLPTNITGVSVPDGWQLLDGSVVDDADSPMDGVTLPNINNGVFIMGNSTAGTSGGSDSYTLTESQLPAHTHTINHGHSDTIALGDAEVGAVSHTHTMPHTHKYQRVAFGSGVTDRYSTQFSSDPSDTSISNNSSSEFLTGFDESEAYSTSGSGILAAATVFEVSYGNKHTTGAIGAPSGSGASATTGGNSSSTEISISGSVTDHSGPSGSTGSGSSIDNVPEFITTNYIVRIK